MSISKSFAASFPVTTVSAAALPNALLSSREILMALLHFPSMQVEGGCCSNLEAPGGEGLVCIQRKRGRGRVSKTGRHRVYQFNHSPGRFVKTQIAGLQFLRIWFNKVWVGPWESAFLNSQVVLMLPVWILLLDDHWYRRCFGRVGLFFSYQPISILKLLEFDHITSDFY